MKCDLCCNKFAKPHPDTTTEAFCICPSCAEDNRKGMIVKCVVCGAITFLHSMEMDRMKFLEGLLRSGAARPTDVYYSGTGVVVLVPGGCPQCKARDGKKLGEVAYEGLIRDERHCAQCKFVDPGGDPLCMRGGSVVDLGDGPYKGRECWVWEKD